MTAVATRQSRSRSPGAKSKHSGEPCTRCEVIHRGCTGHGKKTGKACKRAPGPGSDVCTAHGYKGRAAELAKERFGFAQTEGEIAALMREVDIAEQHPIDGLLEVVRHTGGMMRMLHLMVMGLDEAPALEWYEDEMGVQHCVNKNDSIYGVDHNSDQVAHVLVVLYEKWATLYGRACKMALDANIDERLMRNQEATSSVFFGALGVAFKAAELTVAQQERFRLSLAQALRAVVTPELPAR